MHKRHPVFICNYCKRDYGTDGNNGKDEKLFGLLPFVPVRQDKLGRSGWVKCHTPVAACLTGTRVRHNSNFAHEALLGERVGRSASEFVSA